MCIWTTAELKARLSARKTGLTLPPPHPQLITDRSKAVLFLLLILISYVRSLSVDL